MTIGLNIGHVFGWAVLAAAVALASSPGAAPAADHLSPPMGWNSHTGYSIADGQADEGPKMAITIGHLILLELCRLLAVDASALVTIPGRDSRGAGSRARSPSP